ncbi:hypothetical protein HH310_13165 [Actinoplanes sp. TBRC 11911]|uniref:hypothetical protein n=1 Tax=Actinoplanes sp. TBRC 11911 TaxID=2729386 RepID=UPI00145D8538|nr:hypothetical protein [Actinoplanes sp. TBRC 11911]NMO52142.1 hypothetical protein [Actinoplanes sp. TBRC 11911]
MRSLGTRRVAMAAGVATVAVIGLAGCSAGQVAETAILQPAVSGVNTTSPDGSLLIRNLQVVYNNTDGYKAGDTAPIEVSLFNQTESTITVLISSTPQQGAGESVVSAQQIGVSGGAAPSAAASEPSPSASEPSPSESAAAPELAPARFTIEPHSAESFMPGDPQELRAVGLSGDLANGSALALTVESSATSQPLQLLAPVAIPLSPAPRASGAADESEEGGN